MKKDKLKRISLRLGIAFFLVIGLLTYFSDTIDYMLLPKVKTATVINGTLSGEKEENPNIQHYMVPVSAVAGFGSSGQVYALRYSQDGKAFLRSVSVQITSQDEMYYEVTSSELYNGMQVVYHTSKPVSDGDRVYAEEG